MTVIRRATKEDHALLKAMYFSDIEPHEERAESFAHDLLTEMNTNLCMDGNVICGTVSWAIRGGMDDGVIEIIGLGVKDSYQRKGIATALINHTLKEAQEMFRSKEYYLRRAFLFMEFSNESARQFYRMMDFKEVANIPEFYPSDGASIFVKAF